MAGFKLPDADPGREVARQRSRPLRARKQASDLAHHVDGTREAGVSMLRHDGEVREDVGGVGRLHVGAALYEIARHREEKSLIGRRHRAEGCGQNGQS